MREEGGREGKRGEVREGNRETKRQRQRQADNNKQKYI